MNNDPQGATQKQVPSLQRALGLRIAIAVVVGNVIGSGIFVKPGGIAADGGRFGLIIAIWITGGLLCLMGGLCLAELAAMLPRAGGLYVYLRQAYGRPVAFLYGWNEVLFGKPASIDALAWIFIGSLGQVIGWEPSLLARVGLAIGLILALAWLNVLGVVWGGRLQLVVTIVKAGFLGLIALLPFLLLPFSHSIDLANYATVIEPRQTQLASQIGVILLAVMWAYNGWNGVAPLAEEIREPQRNIPWALFGGIGILIMLYVSANVAYHGVLSMSEMSAAGEHAAARMLESLFGKSGQAAMSSVIMCSTLGAINSNLLLAPRVSFAMGRDGTFFRALGTVHANYRTPAAAIIVLAMMSIGLLTVVAAAQHWAQMEQGAVGEETKTVGPSETSQTSAAGPASDGEASSFESARSPAESQRLWPRVLRSLRDDSLFDLLTNFVIFGASIFDMLTVLAVIVLRWREPDRPRPYRTLGYPLVPLAYLAVYAWFLAQVYASKPLEARMGLLIIALGIPAYALFRAFASREP